MSLVISGAESSTIFQYFHSILDVLFDKSVLDVDSHTVSAGFEEKSIWSLKKGKRKGSDEQVSIFTYEIRTGSEAQFELAKSSLKRIKTLRHPSVLQYLDSFENDKVIYVATEYVEPLGFYLDKIQPDGRRDLYLAWAVFQITVSCWVPESGREVPSDGHIK